MKARDEEENVRYVFELRAVETICKTRPVDVSMLVPRLGEESGNSSRLYEKEQDDTTEPILREQQPKCRSAAGRSTCK